MNSINKIIAEGKRLCEDATQGQWKYCIDSEGRDYIEANQYRTDGSFWRRCSVAEMMGGGNAVPQGGNAEFIAHHNPENMKLLYETLERAIEVIENLRSGTYSILEDNEPDIECRGDEDCGHCHYISVDKDAFEFLASIEKREEE